MCTYTMESIVDPCDSADTLDLDPDWLNKYMETENVFLDYLKSLTFTSPSNVDMADSILPEYDGSENGFEALDNLCELLVSLCDSQLNRHESIESTSTVPSQDSKKLEPRNKRSLKCLSSHYGKELQVKPNRARSHSSVGVDEILKTHHDLAEIASSESRRKSRRVSLGMRPKFSNWSKVKGAFKRDKSTGRADSRDDYVDVMCYSGDETGEKIDPYSSSSHENTGQLSSSEEEFEFYTDGFFNEAGIAYQVDDISSDYGANGTPENTLMKSKSAMLQPQSHNVKLCYSPNVNSGSHKNPFKWYRTKSITPTGIENGIQEAVSTPPSPFKSSRFLYDDESVSKMNDDASDLTNPDEILQEVQNKYESLQKRLSREFYEKYHDWRKLRDGAGANDEDDKTLMEFDASKLAPYLEERNLTPGFKQKFQEWQKLKGLSLSPTRTKINKNENPNTLKKSKSDWHKWRPGSKSESNVLRFLDKEQGAKPNPPEKKELAWLEKELQKVAREKQRLEKEKEKYAERETRLQNMKRAIKSGRKRKQEVVVPTSTGLYRFQGISSKFTRKLYEWEKAKGITAESSTFALLDPYYSGPKIQRNVKPQINDTIASLSRSRSVGSVDVAGVGTSILQSASVNHQQSSLSLNDMEQLEEAHLQVENDNLMRSTEQLFDNDDEKELDLITNESLDIPDYNKNHDISRNIPILSSSNNPLHDSALICAANYSKQVRDDRKLSDGYGTDSENLFCGYSGDTLYEMSSDKRQRDRDSANADAESIVNQIKKLRAGTSVDDEDRINTLTNLQHLADQLLEMVHIMNNKKNENVDELAGRIAELAVELKREIKNLTSDELQAEKQKKISGSGVGGGGGGGNGGGFFYPEDVYTDTEGNENDSPTVHCTFTLPSWRVKHTTPSSTESESSNTRNKYHHADAKPSKSDRHRNKHYKEADNSSGGDENYDAGDETTVYLDLRNICNKKDAAIIGIGAGSRRESSDNISTSNSESFLSSEPKKTYAMKHYEPVDNDDQVLYCSLTLDSHKGNEIKTNYSREKRSNVNESGSKTSQLQYEVSAGASGELDKSLTSDNEDEAFKTEVRSYSPKPLSSKRKCTSCGKIKRISKSRKSSNTYCPCGKKETSAKVDVKGKKTVVPDLIPNRTLESIDLNVAKSASYSNSEDLCATNRKLGKISRSKVYDFKSMTDIDKSSTVSGDIGCGSDKNLVNVIVPTTRKIFAPLQQDENGGASAVVSYTVDECNDDIKNDAKNDEKDRDPKFIAPPWVSDRAQSASPSTGRKDNNRDEDPHSSRCRKKPILEMHASVNKLPPASPLTTKRNLNKDTTGVGNSSIKQMIAHYNKLMAEKPERRSSEGNCWSSNLQKSPVLERRYRFEHLKAESDINLRKSKSAVLSDKSSKSSKTPMSSADNSTNCLSKSSSAGSIHYMPITLAKSAQASSISQSKMVDVKIEEPKINEPLTQNYSADESHNSQISILSTPSSLSPLERNSSFESVVSETKLRNLRLQEAKNKFFNEYPTKITIEYLPKREFPQPNVKQPSKLDNATPKQELIDSPTKEQEPNFNLLLNKSISTGAIDDRTRTFNLPVCEKSPSKSKFGFSSIASKFRKVKMRRHGHKDPEMSAVSSLCRASLLVNLDKDGKPIPKEYYNSSKSCPSSPVMQRNVSKRNSSSN